MLSLRMSENWEHTPSSQGLSIKNQLKKDVLGATELAAPSKGERTFREQSFSTVGEIVMRKQSETASPGDWAVVSAQRALPDAHKLGDCSPKSTDWLKNLRAVKWQPWVSGEVCVSLSKKKIIESTKIAFFLQQGFEFFFKPQWMECNSLLDFCLQFSKVCCFILLKISKALLSTNVI
jgi:hypothetical protein